MRKTMLVLLCLMAAIGVKAGDGSSCYNAIELTKVEGETFNFSVNQPKTVWFSAWTFDLPLKVCFTPIDPAFPPPDVEMDFTCRPGVYEDSILCSLFCPSSSTGLQFDMPHKAVLTKEGDSYCISMGKTYRDLLLKTGISYNVQVFVKVVFKSAGGLTLVPDSEFADCMDGGKFFKLGDTVNIKSNDTERYVVLPFVQWKEDSIRCIWQGTEPCLFAFANTCQFDPMDVWDANILDRKTIQPGDTISYSAARVKEYAEFENAQAGMYYGRMLSNSEGVFKIERIPVAPPDGDATLLRYDRAVTIMANDTNALFALRRDTFGLRFDSPTDHVLRMYIGKTADFTPSTAIASYQYDISDKGHSLILKRSEVEALWEQTTDSYLYVRFQTSARTTVTPYIWSVSACAEKWGKLPKGSFTVDRSGNGAVYYRLYYNEWKNGEITFKWGGSQACTYWIADTCGFSAKTTDPRIIPVKDVGYGSLKSKTGTKTFSLDEIAQWADYVDDEGNLYVLFNTSAAGAMNITSDAPEETDPTYPSATIAVACIEGSSDMTVRVSENQTIVIKDIAGSIIKQWDAEVGEAYIVTLPAGAYTLSGEAETIALKVP